MTGLAFLQDLDGHKWWFWLVICTHRIRNQPVFQRMDQVFKDQEMVGFSSGLDNVLETRIEGRAVANFTGHHAPVVPGYNCNEVFVRRNEKKGKENSF